MSFQQVFFTSCEEGLSSGKGFQVKAASPEIPPAILQTVERLGLYKPPLSFPSRPTPEEIKQFPVSLIYQTLNENGAVLGQAKYVGIDYTGRFGNFFTHSLISRTPYSDFCEVNRMMPIEMWKSGVWITAENDSTSLPDIEKISRGKIEFPNVQEFLKDAARREILPRFLTAIVEGLKENRRVIIVDDNENIALWIAAASFALPFHLVLKLTFNTYLRDPYQSEALIAGTTEDSTFNFAPHEIEYQFFVFDTIGGRFTKIEPNGFAAKSAFLYEQPDAEAILGFAGFVEEAAPDLPIEELDDALATYAYFENIDLPDIDDVKVLVWCSKYLPKFVDRNFDNLFGKVTENNPVETETLQAATDFYLATLSSAINTQNIRRIEDLYFQWLISTVSRTADVAALEETAEKLPPRVQLNQNNENTRKEWLKSLRDTQTSSRFAVMLEIGNRLGFLEDENEILRWLGKNVVGKWLEDSSIQKRIQSISNQTGGRNLLEGITECLVGQTDNISLFTALSTLISDEKTFRILLDYAVGIENLPLYLRLSGTKANLSSGQNLTDAFIYLLGDVQQIFRTEITSEIIQSAFNAIWLDRTPTLEEAIQLVSPPLIEYVVKSDIPSQLVDLINPETETFSPHQAELAKRLASNDVYLSLGSKAGIARAFYMITEIQHDFVDPEGETLGKYLMWAAENKRFIPTVSSRLHEVLGQKFVKVKNVQVHSRKLPEYITESSGGFLKGYASEVEKILQEKEKHLEIARLLKTWAIAAKNNRTLSAYLTKWTGVILKKQSRKGIENIEKALDNDTFEIWTAIKEEIKEQDKGILGRFIGSVFRR